VTHPVVSIIIPTYNRAALLANAIQSVRLQTYSDFELIIVDDASTDNTREVAKDFHDSRIQYLPLVHNRGVSTARNAGLKECRGKYIAFLDSDDEWVPEKLAKQIQVFETSDEKVGAIYSSINIIDGQAIQQKDNQVTIAGDIYENLLYQNFVGTPSSVIVKRESLTAETLFDPLLRCAEDWDFWLQIAKNWHFARITEPLIIYRNHNDQERGSTNSDAIVEGYLRFLNRYHPPNVLTAIPKTGTFTAKQKAGYLMNIARRLMCHGHLIHHAAAIKLAKQYFYLAYRTHPTQPKLLLHYLAALTGADAYVRFQKLESDVRQWGGSILKRNAP
jgi:glycosyltransferase involved in cell wall biosynthesis